MAMTSAQVAAHIQALTDQVQTLSGMLDKSMKQIDMLQKASDTAWKELNKRVDETNIRVDSITERINGQDVTITYLKTVPQRQTDEVGGQEGDGTSRVRRSPFRMVVMGEGVESISRQSIRRIPTHVGMGRERDRDDHHREG